MLQSFYLLVAPRLAQPTVYLLYNQLAKLSGSLNGFTSTSPGKALPLSPQDTHLVPQCGGDSLGHLQWSKLGFQICYFFN